VIPIRQCIPVPTGDILIVEGEHGPLECLSLGDYGKDVNLVEKPVQHTDLLPLTEKWVITISSQYGCSMGCTFCDVPKVGPGRNATLKDLQTQILAALSLHPDCIETKRLNVHFARMGEPTFNPAVIDAAYWLKETFGKFANVHPVVSTMMPRSNKKLREFLKDWMWVKNWIYKGEAGLQLSINTTDNKAKCAMFNGNDLTIHEIQEWMAWLPKPKGRKITLNFAVADWEIDPQRLYNPFDAIHSFDPQHFVIKLTPMHVTHTAIEKGIRTAGDYTTHYPYEHHAAALRAAGYNVLVFIASREEDESRITCGNAILSGTAPFDRHYEGVWEK
jgi:23S rRNA (adenine2503-C2)-methyltransferase